MEHTVKAFDDDLTELRGMISEMGGRAEQALDQALRALATHDLELARQVVAGDKRIDEIEAEVERRVVQVMALRAPMADDLREMVAVLKIAAVVERIGDYSKNIARRIPQMTVNRSSEAVALLQSMAAIAKEMVHDVLDAFAARDADVAVRVSDRDQAVDDFYSSIFRTLVTFMMENPRTIGESAQLLFVARSIERIADHATNVAEMVYYAVTGGRLADRERASDNVGGAER